MKNRKGFTMMELLATIVIIGIVMTIGVVAVSNIVTNSRNKYNNTQKELVQSAAQEYYLNNKTKLPTVYLEEQKVTLKELESGKYINSVKDAYGSLCSKDDSYVVVTKTGNNKYKYNAVLKCGDRQIGEEERKNPSTLLVGSTWDYSEYSKVFNGNTMLIGQERETKPNIRYYTNNKIVVKVNLSGDQITGYKYVVNKILDDGEKKYKESEVKEVNATSYQDTIVIDKDHYKDGVYQIQIIAYNGENKYNDNIKSNKVVVDTRKPRCNIKLDGDWGENNWYYNRLMNITLSVTEVNIHKYSFETDEKVNKNQHVAPTVKYHETIDHTFKRVQDNTPGIKWYGDIEDRAGNNGKCESVHFKLDKDKPSCMIAINQNKKPYNENKYVPNPNGVYTGGTKSGQKTGWYAIDNVNGKNEVTLNLEERDDGPSLNWKRKLTTSSSASYETGMNASGNITHDGYTWNIVRYDEQKNTAGITWKGYVKDYAGNVNKCETPSFKVDIVRPTCIAKPIGKEGENGWFIQKPININTRKKDDLSGIYAHGLSKSSSATYNSQETQQFNQEMKPENWYCHVEDIAGNTNRDVYDVKIDTIKPGITNYRVQRSSYSKYHSELPDNGYNDEDPMISFSATDTNPIRYEYSIGSPVSPGVNQTKYYNELNYGFGCSVWQDQCSGSDWGEYITVDNEFTGYYYTIYLTAKDEAGNRSIQSASYQIYKDCSDSRRIWTLPSERGIESPCDAKCGGGNEIWYFTTKWYDVWTDHYCENTEYTDHNCNMQDCCSSVITDSYPSETDDTYSDDCSESCGSFSYTTEETYKQYSAYDPAEECDDKVVTKTESCGLPQCQEDDTCNDGSKPPCKKPSSGSPSCPSISVSGGSEKKWTNNSIKLSYSLNKDSEYSLQASTSKLTSDGFSDYTSYEEIDWYDGDSSGSYTLDGYEGNLYGGGKIKVRFKVKRGNRTIKCKSKVFYIDKEPPELSMKDVVNGGSITTKLTKESSIKQECDVWYFNNHGIKLVAKDHESGIKNYGAKVTFSGGGGSCRDKSGGGWTCGQSLCGGNFGAGNCQRCYWAFDKAGNKSNKICSCEKGSSLSNGTC